jgi:hypothetical protein
MMYFSHHGKSLKILSWWESDYLHALQFMKSCFHFLVTVEHAKMGQIYVCAWGLF